MIAPETTNLPGSGPPGRFCEPCAVCDSDPKTAYSGGSGMPAMDAAMLPPLIYSLASAVGYIFPLLIGTLLVTGEFRHKTLTPTFLATPRRGIALTGKVAAGVVMGALYGALALIATVGPGAGALAAFGLDTGLGASDTWALLGRVLLSFAVWVLVGIGVGTLVRGCTPVGPPDRQPP